MKHLILPLLLASTAAAQGACPKSKKEWQSQGPGLLLESAVEHLQDSLKDDATGLREKLGKKGSSAATTVSTFQEKKQELVMVQARDEKADLLFGGVMRCNKARKRPELLSLTWVKGEKSGLVRMKDN